MRFSDYMRSRGSKQQNKKQAKSDQIEQQHLSDYENKKLSAKLDTNISELKAELGNSSDVVIRELELPGPFKAKAVLLYIQGLVDEMRVNETVVEALQAASLNEDPLDRPEAALKEMKNKLLSGGRLEDANNWKELFQGLFTGNAIVLLDGSTTAIASSCVGGERRSVEEAKSEVTIRGPREGFVESMRVNTALIRRKIRSPKLWLEQMTIGRETQTPVGIMYMKGLVDERVLQELRNRLGEIDIDGILDSGYIEELIADQKWTPFPTYLSNERPDVIAASLLEGRIAILVDGTPFVIVAPAIFNMFFQAAEDYYQRYDVATFLRLLRFFSFFLALAMPSMYVAVVGYHQEMIPTPLLLKLVAQREGVPFPVYLEAFIMEFVFEILREAVVRMPSAVGNAISIVGGMVIGQSVVEAGIVSPAVVIVVAFTAITSFVSPTYNLGIAARLLRFLLLAAASTLGFYGLSLIVLLVLLHLTNLRSLGMPYMKPFSPFMGKDWMDSIVRAPLWLLRNRPQMLASDNPTRSDLDVKALEGEEPVQ
ncbi:spore germination protein [Paenibacillus sp. NEAU-GSW1]|uniref:spore germination protein n=1 Tax=Paenibacillus sp. NEAU-GSW1 TaxID=2682486 RepID=UPI0012E1B4BC|nr:spore germination protein [Paenibacillus sp. NEAU-GSW1]MUT65074.1 spore germination protein [Paenibacillus sp. NEAU-GSW1]